MKLGELRGVIRKTKGNPSIVTQISGVNMTLSLMKTPLLEELERAFPGGKAIETHLSFDEATGLLSEDGLPFGAVSGQSSAPIGSLTTDVAVDVAAVAENHLDLDALDLELEDSFDLDGDDDFDLGL